ncbi:hypothetical protein MFFC18_18170 [Mariniblastus fucicola]|uniref:Transposase DDE domain-containing protein n=1 Tax=Mariniblastus fucicola TaxID=980251 RepID=A0A5B9PBT7_9BACT|nr:hypothetical protein MFFC18_18170 [Mariniblastus fucicola]
MGACDHPATGQPRTHLRFGSTLCYPRVRSWRSLILATCRGEVEHVVRMIRACQLHVRARLRMNDALNQIDFANACCLYACIRLVVEYVRARAACHHAAN